MEVPTSTQASSHQQTNVGRPRYYTSDVDGNISAFHSFDPPPLPPRQPLVINYKPPKKLTFIVIAMFGVIAIAVCGFGIAALTKGNVAEVYEKCQFNKEKQSEEYNNLSDIVIQEFKRLGKQRKEQHNSTKEVVKKLNRLETESEGQRNLIKQMTQELKRIGNKINSLEQQVQQHINASKGIIEEINTKYEPETSIDPVRNCSVGMRNRSVADWQLTASSVYDDRFIAGHGRLDNTPHDEDGGCWIPNYHSRIAGEWLQVDLLKETVVTGVVTQGRSHLTVEQWITSYTIEYGNGPSTLKTIKDKMGKDKVFQGNADRNSYVINRFKRPILARFFRLIVESYYGAVSLRMDYVTC